MKYKMFFLLIIFIRTLYVLILYVLGLNIVIPRIANSDAVAAGKSLIYYEKSETNLADILTKSLSGSKRDPLAESLLSG